VGSALLMEEAGWREASCRVEASRFRDQGAGVSVVHSVKLSVANPCETEPPCQDRKIGGVSVEG